ncbi:IS21 family transposase [Salimicrobium humidisoli]|uniref:Integrase n=1 Tax=Salimicrobium humidisoli TaxID=2029857 RepID=A0ABX4HPE0_9BACI|nr:IS21 family transposase [Salimicrobium humidisoli]PBB04970.1 integrase [Salimicrobium humidisoli]
MLEVTDIKYIRKEVNEKGCSYSDVARRTNTDVRTVKKHADQETFRPSDRTKKNQPAPVMDPVKPTIDEWLKDDLKKKKKYRRTAKRIWQLLKDDGFKGSERSVRNYVSRKKKELIEEGEDASLPLESKPGMAQVDFGEAPFVREGKVVDLPYLVLSFPYGNGFYFQVFESQNQECFLEGLKRFFDKMNGVPRAIRFDNLSPAVKKVLANGERELTEGFQAFVLHYGFDYEFCNPGAGNEKGHVEAMVKYVRNNFLLPERTVYDLEALNESLWKEAEKDRHRPHYEKEASIAELHKEDLHALYYLPETSYETIRYESLKADKYGFVTVDQKKYSTSPRFAKQRVTVGVRYDCIFIFQGDDVIVSHRRMYGQEKKSMDWVPYVSLMAKRPTALKYTTFFDQLPHPWQAYLDQCTLSEKKEALKLLAKILKDQQMDKAVEALKTASYYGHPSADAIQQVYHQQMHGRGYRETVSVPQPLPSMPKAHRGMKQYNAFFATEGVSDHA